MKHNQAPRLPVASRHPASFSGPVQGLRAGMRQRIALHAALLCALCNGIWPLLFAPAHPARCAAQAAREGRFPVGSNARRKACVCCKLNKAPPLPRWGSRAQAGLIA